MKVLLYSGGMDSWLIDKLWKPDIKLFFDTSIGYNKIEKKHLPKDVKIINLNLKDYELPESTHTLPLRNLLFLAFGSYYGNEICLGTVKGDHHYNNSYEFLKKFEDLLNSLYKELDSLNVGHKQVKLVAPYRDYTKADLLREYVKNGGNLKEAYENTFSCYEPINGQEYGHCKPCLRKREEFKEVGYDFK